MKLFITIYTCLLWLLFPLVGNARSTDNGREWPFGVTANGQPIVIIPLLAFPDEAIISKLFFKHELVYDGADYFSKMVVAQLASYLVTKDPLHFEWRQFDGTVVSLELGKEKQAQHGSWILTRVAANRYRISAVGGGEDYEYIGCRPSEARKYGRKYRFTYAGNHCVVERVEPSHREMFSVEYNDNGTMKLLWVPGGKKCSFYYNSSLQLVMIDQDIGITNFSYISGLLTEIRTKSETRPYVWGKLESAEYFKLSSSGPVIISDLDFGYKGKMERRKTTVFFRSKDDKIRGQWEVDLLTRKIRMNLRRR